MAILEQPSWNDGAVARNPCVSWAFLLVMELESTQSSDCPDWTDSKTLTLIDLLGSTNAFGKWTPLITATESFTIYGVDAPGHTTLRT